MASKQLRKVAVVTGSYRGIGFEIVKGLCQKFDGDVYMTARSKEKASESLKNLEKMGLNPCFHQLEIDNQESISQLATFIKDSYGGLDVLVNNAGVMLEYESDHKTKKTPSEKISAETININYKGTINVCNSLFPLLRSNARVVHVSSHLGFLNFIKNKSIKEKIANKNVTYQDLDDVMDSYLTSVKNGTWKKEGYPDSPYSMSKIGINAATGIQQRDFDQETTRSGIVVSAMCPGYCKTEMTGGGGIFTAEQGAETAIFLGLLPADFKGERGKLWAFLKVVNFKGSIASQVFPMLKKLISDKIRGNKAKSSSKALV